MTARNTNASATDLRLWRAPTFDVMETVKRLATTVSTRRTNHENKPARVRKGSLTVEMRAEVRSSRPRAEMLPKSKVLFQFLRIFIMVSRPSALCDSEF